MSEQKIEMGKQYRTRNGRAVRVLCVDANNKDHPVVALVSLDGVEQLVVYTQDGCYYGNRTPDDADLIEVKPRIKRKVWLNVYPEQSVTHTYGNFFFSKESADDAATATRIACVEVDIDVEEGHGL